MCIAILSTAHPAYPFILLSNRDEFLQRPTARVHWWDEPHSHVIAPQDLQRPERGTWLGMTKDGRIAVLTNFRDEGVELAKDKSRGALVSAWLKPTVSQATTEEGLASDLIHKTGIHNVGGFSLVFGRLQKHAGKGLAILSNRSETSDDLRYIVGSPGETHALSNSHYGDLSWPKVVHGELLLKQAIAAGVQRGDSKERLIESLFDVLCVDTLPKREQGQQWISYVRQLRNSIMIPKIGGEVVESSTADALRTGNGENRPDATMTISDGGAYATQTQTVILVNTGGVVTWTERTLYDQQAQPVSKAEQDVTFEFRIDGWEM